MENTVNENNLVNAEIYGYDAAVKSFFIKIAESLDLKVMSFEEFERQYALKEAERNEL